MKKFSGALRSFERDDYVVSLDAGLFGPGVDVGEERQHPVQVVDGIDLGFVGLAAVQHVAGGLHLAVRSAFGVKKEELQLEGPCGVQAFGGQSIDLPLERVEAALRVLPGVGAWTAAEVRQRAHGDPDAVSDGDAHLAGQVRLELDGLDSADLPTLAWAPDVDPTTTILVRPTDPA